MAMVGLLCGTASGAGHAADDEASAPRTRWACQVVGPMLDCHLERNAAAPLPAAAPLDARLPPIVRELRLQPANWRGRTVRIPLFNQPFDDSPVRELAQAVLCGTAGDCDAVLVRDRWSTASAWLDFADANDPVLQRGE